MSSWIKLVAGYRSHPKTLRLRKILGQGAQWYPVALWLYCADSCPSGEVGDDLIEEACGWSGKAGRLLDALKAVGFVDEGGVAHDWSDWSGADLQKIEDRKEADRKRKSAASPKRIPPNSGGTPGGVRPDSGGTPPEHPRARPRASAPARRLEETEIRGEEEHGAPPSGGPTLLVLRDPENGPARRISGSPEARCILDFLDTQLRKHFPTLPIPEPWARPKEHVQLAERLKALYHGKIPRLLFGLECAFDKPNGWLRTQIQNAVQLHAYHGKVITESEFLWNEKMAVNYDVPRA